MSFITNLPPMQAVVFFAGQASKHNPDCQTLETAIQRGIKKAKAAYASEGKTDKVSEVDAITVDMVMRVVAPTPPNVYDQEPCDSGNHYDSYRAAKQRRRNGLLH